MGGTLNISSFFQRIAPTPLPANDRYDEVIAGGLKTVCLSREGLAAVMLQDCLRARQDAAHPKLVFAANGHSIALAARDAGFRSLMNAADLIHADGQAVIFAANMLTNSKIPERSATTDLIHDAAAKAAQHGLRFFLLGATEEINARAAESLRQAYPGLLIAGRRHGYFSIDEEEELCDEINLCMPDVIWVGLGVPLEYEFTVRNRMRLRAGWLATCGGCFNFVTGAYARAPGWMRQSGLEWLHRLWCEPKRLFWRYAVTNPLAIFLLLTRTKAVRPGCTIPRAAASRTAAA